MKFSFFLILLILSHCKEEQVTKKSKTNIKPESTRSLKENEAEQESIKNLKESKSRKLKENETTPPPTKEETFTVYNSSGEEVNIVKKDPYFCEKSDISSSCSIAGAKSRFNSKFSSDCRRAGFEVTYGDEDCCQDKPFCTGKVLSKVDESLSEESLSCEGEDSRFGLNLRTGEEGCVHLHYVFTSCEIIMFEETSTEEEKEQICETERAKHEFPENFEENKLLCEKSDGEIFYKQLDCCEIDPYCSISIEI